MGRRGRKLSLEILKETDHNLEPSVNVVNFLFTASRLLEMTPRGVQDGEGGTNYCGVTRILAARFSLGRDSMLMEHSILACLQWEHGTSRSQRIWEIVGLDQCLGQVDRHI